MTADTAGRGCMGTDAEGGSGGPGVTAVFCSTWNTWAMTIRPDARPADLISAWASLPEGMHFVEAFGDVEVTLVFRSADQVEGDSAA
ncbi:hypothetical protein [Frankia sp. Cppng1_Ct_nod]|uniref:hypothetical protein n=1 Tax=Frankia sp. Cppng1_Ct_nod TaxID=2897162 RepID=UPI0010412217|nr:hypothetical protein [Frankia sp. Cppng1_Ct_nod]